MARPRFGTDGIRGVANGDLSPELVLALGRAVGRVLAPPRVVIGRDTRRSGPLLEAALAAGLAAEGVEVERVGVLPTPGIAWIAASEDAAGAVVSASHNPFPDNGVKVFGRGGRKLSAGDEAAVEAELDRILAGGPDAGGRPPRTGGDVAAVVDRPEAAAGWLDALAGSLDGRRLDGVRVVVDCGHGAASAIAGDVLRGLGASVTVLHAEPDGTNINAGCGSTDPSRLQQVVADRQADAGLAFDGDADRVVAVDERGVVVDGDEIIAVCAIDRHERGVLAGGAVAVTVMSNLGLRLGLAERGIGVVETPVGDRHVLEALDRHGLTLGGEQSGHVIFRDLASTGDGLLTGLQLLDVVHRRGRPLSELAGTAMTKLPQVLRNVEVRRGAAELVTAVAADVAAVERDLGGSGRVLLRPSGTEPVVRVMAEAPTEAQARAAVDRLVAAVERAAGA